MFRYDACLVGELLEHFHDHHVQLDDIELYTDLERALVTLQAANVPAHRIASLYTQGYTNAELANLYMVSERHMRYVLDAIFQALALILNGEA